MVINRLYICYFYLFMLTTGYLFSYIYMHKQTLGVRAPFYGYVVHRLDVDSSYKLCLYQILNNRQDTFQHMHCSEPLTFPYQTFILIGFRIAILAVMFDLSIYYYLFYQVAPSPVMSFHYWLSDVRWQALPSVHVTHHTMWLCLDLYGGWQRAFIQVTPIVFFYFNTICQVDRSFSLFFMQ